MSDRPYNRMLLGLPQGGGERSAIQAAADLAQFLQLELVGAFITDAGLHALGGLSTRELHVLEHQWRPIDAVQIARDLERAVDVARRRFAENVGNRALKSRFDAINGSQLFKSLIRDEDIVAIVEPFHPGERVTQQFTDLIEAAFATSAAVLMVPKRVARTHGPVLALAADHGDAAIRAATELARALKEQLIIVSGSNAILAPWLVAQAEQLGVQVKQTAGNATTLDLETFRSPPAPKERLRVIARSCLPVDAARLFTMLQGVPVLAVDAGGPGQAERRHDQNPVEAM